MKMIRFNKKMIAILCLMVLTPLFALAGDGFKKAWQEADNKRAEAAAINYEWVNTGKILEQAKSSHAVGEVERAMKLVAKALAESEAAIAQAEREKKQWRNRVPN